MLAAPHHYLISIHRGGVALVAVCKQEVAPLFVIEFLHRVVDTFQVCRESGYLFVELFIKIVIQLLNYILVFSINCFFFQDYFSDCTETIIKENYVVVYEVMYIKHN